MAIFPSYFIPYMLIIIIVVRTNLNEQWSYLKETIAIHVDRYTLCGMKMLIHIFKSTRYTESAKSAL